MINLNLKDKNSWWHQPSTLPKAPEYSLIFASGAIYYLIIGDYFWAAVVIPAVIASFIISRLKVSVGTKQDIGTILGIIYFASAVAYKTFKIQ